MSEEDERSALVALTERQIRLLIELYDTYAGSSVTTKDGQELNKARWQLAIALHALSVDGIFNG